MQNTMLDSVVSSNSQELFDFNAEHNGEACIESFRPEDTRENRFWFTVAMLVAIYNESDQTIRNNVESLYRDGELGDSRIFERRINIEDSWGVPHKTTIYNLNVLNRLGMCCFRKNKEAKKVRDKFNDVLVKHETHAQPELTDEEIMSRALEIAHRTLALREERIKALTAERDEAIRTKAMIGSRREATAMAMASAKSRECKRLTTENEELKNAVGRGNNWRTVAMMTAEWIREFGHAPSWHKLKKFSADLPTEMQPIKDVEEKVVLKNGSETVRLVNRYHREAWAKYREFEEIAQSEISDCAEFLGDAKILDLRADSVIKESLIVDDNIEVAGVF